MNDSSEAAATRRRMVFYRTLADQSSTHDERDKWLALRAQAGRELRQLEESSSPSAGRDDSPDEAPDETPIPQPVGRLVRKLGQVAIGGPLVLVIGGVELRGILWDRVGRALTVLLNDGRQVEVQLSDESPYLIFEGSAGVDGPPLPGPI